MIADGMADRQDDKVMTKLRDLATIYPDGFSPREAQRKRIDGMRKDAESPSKPSWTRRERRGCFS